jgi:DNA repair exonuclease SbcCD ATPase subunit
MRKIKTIAHLSDIHIRKLHRFVEYREVFSRLYKQLSELKPDLIYVGGDVVHGKLDTSPEETRLVADFFLSLAKITDVIIITGNHDVNLQNKSREDALSPIIDLVKKITPNIHYWKQSGVYTIGNVDFGVLSIFDIDKDGNQEVSKLPDPTILKNTHKIALHHGPVDTFVFDNGFSMTNSTVTGNTFKGYDLILLGDIHKRQFLNKDKTIGYCGSLIQQGHAEDPDHGFYVWDLETKKAKYYTVKNDYGFKTLKVSDGKIQNKMKFIPPKGNIKIKYWNTTLEQIKDIQLDLYRKYPNIKSIKPEKQDTLSNIDKGSRMNKIDIGDVRDVIYQNKLITDFLKRNVDNIDEKTIQRVCKINEITNNSPEIYSEGIARNISWKLKSFEFDNMFSYEENNKVNFHKMNGIVGLVAPNHSGKSAMLDSVAYTIFDRCSRTYKALDVMNKRKTTFKAKLNIEIDGGDYWIEREALLKVRRHKDGSISKMCPVKVKFYMIENGEEIDLAGAARRNSQYGGGTNEEVRKLLGTFDDFILTSLSLQTNNANFIDKKQSERKQILCQFMDITIFDQLYDIARGDINDEKMLLKSFKKQNSYTELATKKQQISKAQKLHDELSIQLNSVSKELSSLEQEKLDNIQKLWKLDSSYTEDVKVLEKVVIDTEKAIEESEQSLADDTEYKETLRPLYLEYHSKLDDLDEDLIIREYDDYNEITDELKNIDTDLRTINNQISTSTSLLEELNKYKYDPNCNYCLDNGEEHIKHSNTTKESIEQLVERKTNLEGQKKLLEVKQSNLKNADQNKREYDEFSDELNRISHDAIKIGGKITTTAERIKLLLSELDSIQQKIDDYYDEEQKIEDNKIINEKISSIKDEIAAVEDKLESFTKMMQDSSSSITVAITQKEQIESEIQKIFDIEQKILDYDLYMLAVSKDGIPYELISKTIHSVEAEINEVLDNMMAGFSLKLDMEGKDINVNICYGDAEWSLELASGMEKFVSSLAIRVGLINVSTLPRPNFLCLDEGFGSLDGDNIANMEGAFNYLKSQFDFVLIITHLDSIKDYTDHLVPIDVEKGFSHVAFG